MNHVSVRACILLAMQFSIFAQAYADPILIVDQQNDPALALGQPSISFVGQEFTPTLNGLDTVEFLFTNTSSGASIHFVNIREAVSVGNPMGGAILATSSSFTVPALSGSPQATVAHFDFLNRVPVVPGQAYVLELVQTSGNAIEVATFDNDYYANGTLISGGSVNANADLWFRQGLHAVPEPSGLVLLSGLGLFSTFVRGRRKTI